MTAPPEIFSEGVEVGSALKTIVGTRFCPGSATKHTAFGDFEPALWSLRGFLHWGLHATDTLQQFLDRLREALPSPTAIPNP
jgi:hypothetical protein